MTSRWLAVIRPNAAGVCVAGVVLCLLPIVLSGCSVAGYLLRPGTEVTVPAYTVAPTTRKPKHPIAGAARVDITPPVGYPTGGHGPSGGFARAYWTRLYARAFFFADTAGGVLVLVSCDLFAMPGGLAAGVARDVALRWQGNGLAIPSEAFVIAATHTHQGPGNYMTAQIYNDFGAKYGGFDPALFNFLRDRIALAVNEAIADALDGDEATLFLQTGEMAPGFLLNRSPETFLTNWNARAVMDHLNPPLPRCVPTIQRGEAGVHGWDLSGCPRLRAVDPNITVLTVVRKDERVGALVFFAAHPTVLEHNAPLYSSDFTGVAVSTLERSWRERQTSGRPIVGFFNGAEGDIVARRGVRDLRDVLRAANDFGSSIEALTRNAKHIPVRLDSISARQAILTPGFRYSSTRGSGGFAPAPVFGVAGIGGAEDDRTVFYRFGWESGQVGVPENGQGLKHRALDSDILPFRLTDLLAPPGKFPQEIPISLARIGDLHLAAVPVEMSTAQGASIRKLLGDHPKFELIGLANEYASYLATEDEYAVQDYMGASTLWGPGEGEAIQWALECLSQPLGPVGDCAKIIRSNPLTAPRRAYAVGPRPDETKGATRFGPSLVGDSLYFPDEGFDELLLNDENVPTRTLPFFEWTEWVSDSTEFLGTGNRSVRILEQRGELWAPRITWESSHVPDTDEGPNFLSVLRKGRSSKADAGERVWAVIWLAPSLETATLSGTYKFQVTTRQGAFNKVYESCPFKVVRTLLSRNQIRTNC